MVRQVKQPNTPGWKAVLAVTVAAGGLLWHVLACIESPMAFSPDGKDLALVVSEDVLGKKVHLVAERTFRLMMLADGKTVRQIEQTDSHLLTGPAYSPDGKHICYFRIPLLTKEQADTLRVVVKKRADALAEVIALEEVAPGDPQPVAKPFGQSLLELDEEADVGLPPAKAAAEFHRSALLNPATRVTLVVRDAKPPYAVVAEHAFDLSVYNFMSKNPGENLGTSYVFDRPQYTPDGQTVYASLGNVVGAVDLQTGDGRLIACPALLARLSPDGKTLAYWSGSGIAFAQTDGSRTTHVRFKKDFSPNGVVWADNRTLRILVTEDRKLTIASLNSDGTPGGSMPLPKVDDQMPQVELALAPNGRHVVVGQGKLVRFCDGKGKVLGQWAAESDRQVLAQPTFSPDGRRVAMKLVVDPKDGRSHTQAVVFFSPDGKELSRVKIPPPKPGPKTGGR